MGTYLYLLRSPKLARRVVVDRPDGTVETVFCASISYLTKPHWSPSPREEALQSAQATRMENLWRQTGPIRPFFGTVTSGLESDTLADLKPSDPRRFKIEAGDPVLYWPKSYAPPGEPSMSPVPVLMSDGSGSVGGGKVYGKIREVLPN